MRVTNVRTKKIGNLGSSATVLSVLYNVENYEMSHWMRLDATMFALELNSCVKYIDIPEGSILTYDDFILAHMTQQWGCSILMVGVYFAAYELLADQITFDEFEARLCNLYKEQ